jgi:hypothetical protein
VLQAQVVHGSGCEVQNSIGSVEGGSEQDDLTARLEEIRGVGERVRNTLRELISCLVVAVLLRHAWFSFASSSHKGRFRSTVRRTNTAIGVSSSFATLASLT